MDSDQWRLGSSNSARSLASTNCKVLVVRPDLRRLHSFLTSTVNMLRSRHNFANIVAEDLGRVHVSCWLESDTFLPGKRWGMDGTKRVVILPFGTRPRLLAPSWNTSLATFDIELFICEAEHEGSGPRSFPATCRGISRCEQHSDLCLAYPPVPGRTTQDQGTSGLARIDIRRPWTFESDQIEDCDGRSRAAKWTWNAHHHDPVRLYGAMVVEHQGNDFVIACRVKGKVARTIGRAIPFSNGATPPKWVLVSQISPVSQASNTDLSRAIRALENEMQYRNTNRGGFLAEERPASGNTVIVTEHASAHIGDRHDTSYHQHSSAALLRQEERIEDSTPRTPGPNLQSTSDMAPRTLGQSEYHVGRRNDPREIRRR